MTTPAAGIISAFITVHYLPPEQMGVFNTAALYPVYLSFIHLGVLTAPSRNIPMELGAGRRDEAQRIVETSSAFATLAAAAAVVVIFSLALREWLHHGTSLYFWALLANVPTAVMAIVGLHVDTALRGYQRFRESAAILFSVNVVIVASTLLVYGFREIGAAIRITLIGITGVCVRMPARLWTVGAKVDWKAALSLGRLGFPLFISGMVASYLSVADRSIAALFLTEADVGNMSLAGVLANSLSVIPQSLSLVLLPRIAREFGRTRSPRKLRKFIGQNLALNIAGIFPCALILYFSIGPLVTWLFPKYVVGIPAAKVACLTSACGVYLGVGSVIGVINRMTPYLVVAALSVAFIWCAGYGAVRMGYGIVGIAWARFLGTLLLCIFTIAYSFYLTTLKSA